MSPLKVTSILTMLSATAAVAGGAHALEPKQCLPLAEINAAMKAEAQRTLIIGDRLALHNPTGAIRDATVTRYADVITSNEDGSVGYQLEGDLPRSKTSNDMCVAIRLTNIRLYDARKPGLPDDPRLKGPIRLVLEGNEKIGSRPMIVADAVARGEDGRNRLGLPMIISGNVKARAAVMYARKADGSAVEVMLMGDTEYTPTALSRLND